MAPLGLTGGKVLPATKAQSPTCCAVEGCVACGQNLHSKGPTAGAVPSTVLSSGSPGGGAVAHLQPVLGLVLFLLLGVTVYLEPAVLHAHSCCEPSVLCKVLC